MIFLGRFGNLGIGISASALASTSAFEYKYSFLHSINSLKSYKLVPYTFTKHVISNKVASLRLCLKIFCKDISPKIRRELLSRTLTGKSLCWSPFLIKLLESTLDLHQICSRPKTITSEYIRTFIASTGMIHVIYID